MILLYAKKMSSIPLQYRQQSEMLIQSKMGPFFHVTLNYGPTIPHRMLQQKSRHNKPGNVIPIIYSSMSLIFSELQPQVFVLVFQELYPVWSSATVAHLLQDSACYAFSLYNSILKSRYLRYCCLSISFNQSGLSLSITFTILGFISLKLPPTVFFFFS